MVEEVLAAISMSQRRNLKISGRIALHTALHSVRVQHPVQTSQRFPLMSRSASNQLLWHFG
jgi:hypothetical protein